MLLLLSTALFLTACGEGACPSGWTEDPARVRGLPVSEPIEGPVCWGPQPEGGAREPSGRLLLDPARDDRWLAARVAHLGLHGPLPEGPDCRERLLAEEAHAWTLELRRRRELGVSDPTCPVERTAGPDGPLEAIHAWLQDSSHPRAHQLRMSHARRCRGW